MPPIIQVIVLLTTWPYVHAAVRTVYRGVTVTEPVIKAATLNKDDQLIASNKGFICAQYFCCNGTCHNSPELVSHFQVYSGNLCFIIPNVNVNDSGQYDVVLNGIKNVLNFTLLVEEVPQQSTLVWLIPVIAVSALVVLILVITAEHLRRWNNRICITRLNSELS